MSPDRQSSTWGVRLGQLLLSAKKQDSEAFYEKLKLVRKEQVVPLSAASYECGTYQRGYEYIVRYVCVSLFFESVMFSMGFFIVDFYLLVAITCKSKIFVRMCVFV